MGGFGFWVDGAGNVSSREVWQQGGGLEGTPLVAAAVRVSYYTSYSGFCAWMRSAARAGPCHSSPKGHAFDELLARGGASIISV